MSLYRSRIAREKIKINKMKPLGPTLPTTYSRRLSFAVLILLEDGRDEDRHPDYWDGMAAVG